MAWNDLHQIPFSGKVDFVPIVKALKEIRYDGDFTLESSAFLRDYNEDNILEGAKNLQKAQKSLFACLKKFHKIFLQIGEKCSTMKDKKIYLQGA